MVAGSAAEGAGLGRAISYPTRPDEESGSLSGSARTCSL